MAESIFTSQTPSSPDLTDGVPYCLGTVFVTDADGLVTHIRWFFPGTLPTSTPTVALYRRDSETTGTLLGSGTFTAPVAGAWNTAPLSVPVAITTGVQYVAVVRTVNRYVNTPNFFTVALTNGHLTAIQDTAGAHNGKFDDLHGANLGMIYPQQFFNAGCYFVDVVAEFGSIIEASASLSAESNLTAAALVQTFTDASLAAESNLTVSATVTTFATASLSAESSLTASAVVRGPVVPQLYTFGPCSPWTPIWPRGECAAVLLNPEAPDVTGTAMQAASEILYHLTAQRFGLCEVTLRPCRKACWGSFPWFQWWEYGTYPQPYWWNGTWYNLACGMCPENSCACTSLDEIVLPGPVNTVVEVKLDGVVLTPGVDYRIDDYRKLVAMNGITWPFCQDLNLPDTAVGTMSVTPRYGEEVPVIGQLAVGELGLEIVKALLCEECILPNGVTDISRQGISMTIANISELFNAGFIQLRWCDMFIQAANPKHMQSRSAVYDLDGPAPRAWGTA